MNSRPLFATMLAAGEGTRMKSERPKTLARICGKPMGVHVLDALRDAGVLDTVVVVGHKAEKVETTLARMAPPEMKLHFVEQSQLNGTGDALSVALTVLPDALGFSKEDMPVAIVVPGDTPLITSQTIEQLARVHIDSKAAATLITARMDNPYGYGRVIRGKDNLITRIVEERDANVDEQSVTEINTGIYAFNLDILAPTLRRISPLNNQGEYYLTDSVSILSDMGYLVNAVEIKDSSEALGVNDRVQLAEAEHEFRTRINKSWMSRGVTMVDPASTYIEATVTIGQDTTIWPGCHLGGNTQIGSSVELGPETRLLDCTVGDGAKVTRCEATQADVGSGAEVGPWVVLVPGAKVEPETSTGSFITLR